MAQSAHLRKIRAKTVINATAKQQEKNHIQSLMKLVSYLDETYSDFTFIHEKTISLTEVLNKLKKIYPDMDFTEVLDNTSMKPDGGILYLVVNNIKYPILIGEVKNQGTNKQREEEGLQKQAQGNAIERLGKNVIGFRAFFSNENIFPFVCFGYGCDFEVNSSILDRVKTISMFGALNKTHVINCGPIGIGNRGSFFFREEEWSVDEMFYVMKEIAETSIKYYIEKYDLK